MKNLRSLAFTLLLLTGASLAFSSCEEEVIAPQGEKIGTSSQAGGMEDDGQFD